MSRKSIETKPMFMEVETLESMEKKISIKDTIKGMIDGFRVAIGRTRKVEKIEKPVEKPIEKPEEPVAEVSTDEVEEPEEKGEKEATFPEKVDDIVTSDYLGGSSDVKAGYFNGELFVVKKARKSTSEEGTEKLNTEQLIDEYLSDRIYEAMGFNVPVSQIYNGGRHKVSKFIPGKDLNTFSRFSTAGEIIKKELQKGFVLDCLLANWDVIGGKGGDNIRLGDDGKVYRLDNGGALRFRGRGARKGADFGETVGELESLRRNEYFSDISDEEINRQIDEVVENQDKALTVIDDVSDALDGDFNEVRSIMIKRFEYLKFLRAKHNKEKTAEKEKGIYESAVTNEYFEGWSGLEIDGNAEMKEQIRQNIINAEKRHQREYEGASADLGITVEEFKARLQAKVEDMVKKSNFFRATELGVLKKIMNEDGRWKSQFETGRSNGTFDPRFRAAAEMKMFGFNKIDGPEKLSEYGDELSEDVLYDNAEKRPIYGYFSDEEHGAINSEGRIPPPNNVGTYGRINVKIKRERALAKSTITFQDSLGLGSFPPTPGRKPHFTSIYLHNGNSLNKLRNSSIPNWGETYTEVQYHSGLTMDDIDSIHVSMANGLYREDLEEMREIFKNYKKKHPKSTIKLIEF